MRIAMWSGPRNLSTALMYAFAQRGDCAVVDEPFYAAYLAATGIGHPMRAEIVAAGEPDPHRVAAALSGPIPAGRPHFYQKHMTLHLLPGFPRGWMHDCRHVFLIRHPARVVASYAAKREAPTLDDIGFVQQAALYDEVAGWADAPPAVIDSADIRTDPAGMMRALCAALGLGYAEAMLSWPRGGLAEDGVWAPVWYGAVHASTGFAGAEGPLPELRGEQARLAASALPHYEALAALRLAPFAA